MKKIIILLTLMFLSACSTTKQISDIQSEEIKLETTRTEVVQKKDLMKLNSSENANIIMKAKINIAFPEITNTAIIMVEVAKTDSILVQIFGPMSIPIGKLYANSMQYIMNSNLESITYKGTPTANNIQRVMNVPLSFNDLVYLLRGALPNNIINYSLVNSIEKNNLYLYSNENYAEFALINTETNYLAKLQRKDVNNELIMNVVYSNFITINNFNFAKKILINFPKQNGSVDIEFQEIKIVENCSSPMSFIQPKSYRLLQQQ